MSSIPTTMKAVQIAEHGDRSVLAYVDVATPTISSTEILVKVKNAGVNFIDTYQRSGLYPQAMPCILGREGSGDVVQVGADVKDFKVGDRVAFVATKAFAEYAAVSVTSTVSKLPDNLSYEIGAALLLQGITGWTLVTQAYAVKKGDWVLIHASAGGMGLLLTQMVKILGGNVIGTVSTEAKAKLSLEAGADHVVNYSGGYDGVVAKVQELTGGLGVEVVLDGVGADTFDISLKAVRRLGTVVSFGNASGAVPPVNIMRLAEKNIRLMRTTMYNYVATHQEFLNVSKDLFQLVADGKLNFAIHEVYPIQEVARAQEDLENRKTTGKLILAV